MTPNMLCKLYYQLLFDRGKIHYYTALVNFLLHLGWTEKVVDIDSIKSVQCCLL